jgi:hypothetical protein
MQSTYVWEIITTLTKPEIREVRIFLASPFFNRREDLRLLFDCLAGEAASGKETPGREGIWRQVAPGKAFDDQQMRLLLSYLLKVMEQYFIFKENQNESVANAQMLMPAYLRRKLPRHFQKTQKSVKKQLEAQPLRHSGFHLTRFFTEHQQYLFLSETGRTKELNLQPVEDHLTQAMLALKLRQACLLRSHQAVYNTSYRLVLLDEMLSLAAQPEYQEVPAVSVYYHCYRALFQEESEANFGAFREQLFRYSRHFPKAEMRDLYLLALNFCIKKINENRKTYFGEALDLYKEGLKTELLLEDGKLSRFTYNNIVGIALRMEQEWAWAEWFVAVYKDYLEPSQREAAFSLNSARLAFARRRFDDALLLLQRADYKDLIHSMVAKTLQLKIYFEKQEWELLDAQLKTMRMFIRRNKRMGYHHQNWQNIVRFTQKLTEMNPFDAERRAALKSAIENEEILTKKEWLLRQLELL